jgi:uncharacterized protein (DUF1330 family)
VSIQPTPEQFARLAGSADDGPVVMVNLLRFKATADGIDAADGISGQQAYERYAALAAPFLAAAGGRLLFAGRTQESVIGPEPAEWDLTLAVRYPSRGAFIAMATDPGYLAIHEHRAAALADSRLIATLAVDA